MNARCLISTLLGCAAFGCAALLAAGGEAAVVTKRLGTGLPPSPTAGRLSEAWVAPVTEAPTIDGRLDDAVWEGTRPIVLSRLESYGEISPKTRAWLVHKDRVLYIALELTEPNVVGMKRTVTEPDGPAYRDDSVELFLSPFPGRGYFQIIISSTGAIYDRRDRGDPAHWDSRAEARVAVGRDGWSLEVAVPMSSLGIGDEMPRRWRANIYRNRQAGGRSENQAFSPTFRGDYDVPERFGRFLFTPTSPWDVVEQTAGEQRGVTVEELSDGTTLLLFDLSVLPPGAEVHRARLQCEREPMDGLNDDVLEPIEIYPLTAPCRKGSRPAVADDPLELVAPSYDAFELTDRVRGWATGGAGRGVWVKRFPGWRKDRTFLDLLFEGEADQVLPAATGVKAFHRSGQTFIVWQEVEDPVGRDEISWGELRSILGDLVRQREVRYSIYRSREPITANTLKQAERIAEVEPLSCWNLNGRNIDRPIDQFIATARVLNWHQWNPFQNASIDGEYGRDCAIDRFVIQPGQPPLARGTGLYVHTATKNEPAYYAVVTAIDGIENTRDLVDGANVIGPLLESVAEPEPVLQSELPAMPFFNYEQRRLHYVRWVAPPYTNRPCDVHNWTVGMPNDIQPGAALELNLHRDGHSYWRTHYRIEPGSVVLCPYDFPIKTFWHGYHEAYGTLRPWREGVIRNYTERRLLSFVDWAIKKWPLDRNRIMVTGCQGGASGSGALHLGLRHPHVFNLVLAGHGEPDYKESGEEVQRIWGRPASGLRTENGKTIWEELDLLRTVKGLSAATELPFVSMTYSNRQEKTDELAEALLARGHAVITHTAWGGQRLIPVSPTATSWCVPLDVRKDRSMLAVHQSGKTDDAIRNGSLLWQGADLVDQSARYGVTLHQGAGEFNGRITLRRLQRFKVRPGKRYAWMLERSETSAAGERDPPAPRKGVRTVGKDGLLTLEIQKLNTGTYRLTIVPEK